MLFLKNLFAKFRAVSAVTEAPDNASYAFFRTRAQVLYVLPAFWLIYSTGLAGAFLVIQNLWQSRKSGDSSTQSRRGIQSTLLIFFLCIGGSLCLVHSLGRLRLFVVPFLIVFAANFIHALVASARSHEFLRFVKQAPIWVFIFFAAFQIHAQSVRSSPAIRSKDYVVAANWERRMDQFNHAIHDYRRALDHGDRDPQITLAIGQLLVKQGDFAAAMSEMKLYLDHTRVEPWTGKLEESLAPLKQFYAWSLLFAPDLRLREPFTALKIAQELDGAKKGDDPALNHLIAVAYAQTGNLEKAVEVDRAALERANKLGQIPLAETIQKSLFAWQKK